MHIFSSIYDEEYGILAFSGANRYTLKEKHLRVHKYFHQNLVKRLQVDMEPVLYIDPF